MSWQKEKQRKLGLNLTARRKEYFCRGGFVPLDAIPTWREQWLSSQSADPHESGNDRGSQLVDKVSLYRGDITRLELDAIVNAANNSLLGGGGVDGAIHRGAGPNLRKENQTLRGCPDGEARISCGYDLPAKYVISTVGPRGEYPMVLAAAYANCLSLMLKHKLRSVAFPCISTGIYGYPNDSAARVAIATVNNFLQKHHEAVDRIIFCLFLDVDVDLYERLMPQFFPVEIPAEEKAPANGESTEALAAANGKVAVSLSANQAEVGDEITHGKASEAKESDDQPVEAMDTADGKAGQKEEGGNEVYEKVGIDQSEKEGNVADEKPSSAEVEKSPKRMKKQQEG